MIFDFLFFFIFEMNNSTPLLFWLSPLWQSKERRAFLLFSFWREKNIFCKVKSFSLSPLQKRFFNVRFFLFPLWKEKGSFNNALTAFSFRLGKDIFRSGRFFLFPLRRFLFFPFLREKGSRAFFLFPFRQGKGSFGGGRFSFATFGRSACGSWR